MKKIPVKMTCITCGKVVITNPNRAKRLKNCSQKCRSIYLTGHRPFHYKGGKIRHRGYTYVLAKGHPAGDRDSYVLEHRLVMEGHLGRFLNPAEVVHHKNGERSDNRIDNLELFSSHSEHMKSHYPKGVQFGEGVIHK